MLQSLENQILKEVFLSGALDVNAYARHYGQKTEEIEAASLTMQKKGLLTESYQLTPFAIEEIKKHKPQNAIILAAGPGMRMVPINNKIPKALLEIKGQPIIERTISHLLDVGVEDITVITGFMHEKFQYLEDKYSVSLVYNELYAELNNLHSLSLVSHKLGNTYIVPGDVWCGINPFCAYEPSSWYMVGNTVDNDSCVRVDHSCNLNIVDEECGGNTMIGIAYLENQDCDCIRERIRSFSENEKYNDAFWESVLYQNKRMMLPAFVMQSNQIVEINTYEQLRELDGASSHLHSHALEIIAESLGKETDDIKDISVLKKGMTNRSFLFSCSDKKYIMRIPGEGTDQLINRAQEAEVYNTINKHNLCDNVIYINPKNGYKLTEFLNDAHNCDPESYNDVRLCMKRLRQFHEMGLEVKHEFDLFGQIEYYESLWDGVPSEYKDYKATKENVLSLRSVIEEYKAPKGLTHIDAVPDNFLFVNKDGQQEIRLIDWEYAGMQDPHVDIAMFCIYSMYGKKQIDKTIRAYFTEGCSEEIYTKIYCYIAVCGLLWSNWCEYKRILGVTFGEYSKSQYDYARKYFKLVQKRIAEGKGPKK